MLALIPSSAWLSVGVFGLSRKGQCGDPQVGFKQHHQRHGRERENHHGDGGYRVLLLFCLVVGGGLFGCVWGVVLVLF